MRTPGRSLRRLATLACAFFVIALGVEAAPARGEPRVLERITQYREETWRWQRLIGRPLSPTTRSAQHSASAAYRRWVLRLWRARALRLRREAAGPPHRDEWLCIHRHEGRWTANTGNGYYGGLQMDLRFQRRYGRDLLRRKGPAHRWTALEQIWIAERAHRRGRGFYPWANAARVCGLI